MRVVVVCCYYSVTSSQEVVWCPPVNTFKNILFRCWVELEECVFHEFVNLHDGGLVTTSVTVVGRGEDCDDVSVV